MAMVSNVNNSKSGSDPIFPLMCGAAFMTLLPQMRKFRNVAALSVLSFFLAACGSLSLPGTLSLPTETAPSITSAKLDSDTDGVPDALDNCPDTAEGLPVDSVGCDEFTGVIDGVNFESGSDTLTLGAQQKLADVALVLNRYPGVRVAVAAHTDNQGPATANLQLSKRRVIAVVRYLMEQGVDGNRLAPQAYGESKPLVSNASAAGRARNRRVELAVVK